MIELDSARQEMIWRILNFLEGHKSITRFEMEVFMTKQHRRFLGNYSRPRFINIIESLDLFTSKWETKSGHNFKTFSINEKGKKFLENWKKSPEYAWEMVKNDG